MKIKESYEEVGSNRPVRGDDRGHGSRGVITLEENDVDGTPVIDLSSIVGQWGTPSDSTSEFTIGGSGTDGVAGLYIVNDLGFTITSLQVFVYGTYSTSANSTLKYQCGVNNFFNTCSPSTQQTLPDPSTISQNSPIEFDYFCTTTCTGITNGTEFHLLDSVDGTLCSATRLLYEIEVNGNALRRPHRSRRPCIQRALVCSPLAC